MSQTFWPQMDANFDADPSRGAANPQSQAAHTKLLPLKSRKREVVFQVILDHPEGVTREQIAFLMDLEVHKITGRVTELLAAGLVRETGRFRPTRSGNKAAVLEAAK